MEFSKEQIEKAKNCKTLEEFKVLAKNEGLNLTEEEAKMYFKATRVGELNDEDLDKVAGGTKCSSGINGPNGVHKYVIVTLFNDVGHKCAELGLENRVMGDPDPTTYSVWCKDCVNCFRVGLTHYCGKRWEGNDPLNK